MEKKLFRRLSRAGFSVVFTLSATGFISVETATVSARAQTNVAPTKGTVKPCSDSASNCRRPVKYTGERKDDDGSVCYIYACEFGTAKAHYIYVPPTLKAEVDQLTLPGDGSIETAEAADSKLDLELTQKIRKSIEADKSLATYAHNVKVVADHGKVTLKGSVHSETERMALQDKAMDIAGSHNVNSELSISPKTDKQ